MEFRYDKGGDLTPSRNDAPTAYGANKKCLRNAWHYVGSHSSHFLLVSVINEASKDAIRASLCSARRFRVLVQNPFVIWSANSFPTNATNVDSWKVGQVHRCIGPWFLVSMVFDPLRSLVQKLLKSVINPKQLFEECPIS